MHIVLLFSVCLLSLVTKSILCLLIEIAFQKYMISCAFFSFCDLLYVLRPLPNFVSVCYYIYSYNTIPGQGRVHQELSTVINISFSIAFSVQIALAVLGTQFRDFRFFKLYNFRLDLSSYFSLFRVLKMGLIQMNREFCVQNYYFLIL